jgi:putative hemolysin
MEILTASAPAGTARYSLTLATGDEHVRAAQALRYQVFAGELGATLHSTVPGLDVDPLDAVCDHIVITEDVSGDVVGTYRMLPPGRSTALYCDSEFDLRALAPLRDILVETGRACVHADHRGGAVINLMWAGIARYMHLHNRRWLIGCASVPLEGASRLWHQLSERHLAPPRMRVTPHNPWPLAEPDGQKAAVPPLLRGYLRLGAWICGPPAHDPGFGVADLPVLLSLDRIDPRYLRHFLDQP